jgi:hypothetical protein
VSPGAFKVMVRNRWLSAHKSSLQAACLAKGLPSSTWRSAGCLLFKRQSPANPEVKAITDYLLDFGCIPKDRSVGGRFVSHPDGDLGEEVPVKPVRRRLRRRVVPKELAKILVAELNTAAGKATGRTRGWLRRIVGNAVRKCGKRGVATRKMNAYPNIRPNFRDQGLVVKSRKPGRAKGWRKISDTHLKDELLPCTAETSRWHARSDDCLRALQGTKRAIHLANFQNLSYSAFCKRVAHSRLGICAAYQRQDVCEYCISFDKSLKPRIVHYLQWVRDQSDSIDINLFVSWDEHWLTYPTAAAQAFDASASPSYLVTQLRFFEAWFGSPAISIAAKARGTALCEAMMSRLHDAPGMLERLESLSGHWRLRDSQQSAFAAHLSHPEPDTIYIHSDFAESHLINLSPLCAGGVFDCFELRCRIS